MEVFTVLFSFSVLCIVLFASYIPYARVRNDLKFSKNVNEVRGSEITRLKTRIEELEQDLKKQEDPKLDRTAQKLLADILAGPAIVKIDVIDKHTILQWKG